MEKQVLVNESSLIGIADAIRDKKNEWVEVEGSRFVDDVRVCRTDNAFDFYNCDSTIGLYKTASRTITIAGAVKLKIDIAYSTADAYNVSLRINPGLTQDTTYPTRTSKSVVREEIVYDGTDSVYIYLSTMSAMAYGAYFYAEVIGYDADGKVIQKELSAREPTATYLPSLMADAMPKLGGTRLKHRAYVYESGGFSTFTLDLTNYVANANTPFVVILASGTSSTSINYSSVRYPLVLYYDGKNSDLLLITTRSGNSHSCAELYKSSTYNNMQLTINFSATIRSGSSTSGSVFHIISLE